MKTKLVKSLCGLLLLLITGCSTAKKIDSVGGSAPMGRSNPMGRSDPMERIAVQKTPATAVNIERIEGGDQYDFYISLLDESGEPFKIYIVKGFREQAKAQFYVNLNSVIINDEGEALYALVVDKDIEYRKHRDKAK